jgi:hypothetical protein
MVPKILVGHLPLYTPHPKVTPNTGVVSKRKVTGYAINFLLSAAVKLACSSKIGLRL